MLSILLFFYNFIIIYTKLYISIKIFFQRIKMLPLILLISILKKFRKRKEFFVTYCLS